MINMLKRYKDHVDRKINTQMEKDIWRKRK